MSLWPLNQCAESAVVQVWRIVFSAAICMLLTGLLFLGPLTQLVTDFDREEDIPDFKSMITWRNLIIVRMRIFVLSQHLTGTLLGSRC